MHDEFFFPLLIEMLVKSLPVLLIAALVEGAWARSSAARRHWIWCVALATILLLPATRVFQPRWRVPLQRVTVKLPPIGAVAVPRRDAIPTAVVTASLAPPELHWRWPDWNTILAAMWGSGAALLLTWRLMGSLRLMHLRHTTERVRDERTSRLAAAILHAAGIHRRVELRLSPTNDVPLTWGTLRPVLMLPPQALAWSDTRLIAALRHEAGHIARGDHFARWLASLACALYWPNPLVWFAARRLRATQEQATDDLVLRAGSVPEEYAEQLFDVARSLIARRELFRTAVAMASPSTLESRLLAIVDPARDRCPLTPRAVAVGAFTIALTLGLATAAQLRAQEKAAPAMAERAAEPAGPRIEIDARFVEMRSDKAQSEAVAQWLTDILADGHGPRIATTAPSSSAVGTDVPTVQGLLTPQQLQTVLRALSQRKGVDQLAVPRVTSLSGQRAVIEITRDFSFPTDWKREDGPPKPELRASVELEKDGRWAPKAFETRKVGVSLEALAVVSTAHGETIDLQVTPCVTEFLGFINLDGDPNPPPDPADTITLRDESGRMLEGDRPGRRMRPVFSERKLTSSVSIFPGQTLVLGSQTESAGSTFADASGVSKKKLYRQLLVFVTARVVKGKPAAEAPGKN